MARKRALIQAGWLGCCTAVLLLAGGAVSLARADSGQPIQPDPEEPAAQPAPQASPAPDPDRVGVRWAAAPVWGYGSETGLRAGILARRFDYGDPAEKPFRSLVTAQVLYAREGESQLLLAWERPRFPEPAYRMQVQGFTFLSTRKNYFGEEDDRAPLREDIPRYHEFRLVGGSLRGSLRYRPGGRTVLAGAAAQSGASAKPGGAQAVPTDQGMEWVFAAAIQATNARPLGENSLFHLTSGPSPVTEVYPKLSVGLVDERRDNEFVPTRGSYASVIATGYSWLRIDGDVRAYVPLVQDRWLVLAGQARLSASTPRAPWLERARLGGPSTLRGLATDRFVSHRSFSARLELRSILARLRILGLPAKAGLGVFLDTGKVGQTWGRLLDDELHTSGGFSLLGSYFTDDFLGSLDVAFSREGYTAQIQMGHAF